MNAEGTKSDGDLVGERASPTNPASGAEPESARGGLDLEEALGVAVVDPGGETAADEGLDLGRADGRVTDSLEKQGALLRIFAKAEALG